MQRSDPCVEGAVIRRTPGRWHPLMAALTGALALVTGAGALTAQGATGTISGRVSDAASGAAIAQARVQVGGTSLGTLTADNGTFTLRLVPAGSVVLTVNRIGYEAERVTVTVAPGGSASVEVRLRQAAYSLAAVVTTVTGQQRKVELANATATINVADKVAELPVANMGQLLSGRAAGVQVVSTGETGAGSRVRIRGQGSLSLSNQPVVIIDGVRVTANTGSSSIGVGGTAPSRLDDINPEEIETIEIVKGPSAATLYGTEAAAGVINITTKRGRAGRTVWNLYTENGLVQDPRKGSYPELYYGWGRLTSNNAATACRLYQAAAGSCVQDSVTRGNVLNIDSLTPIATGIRQQYGLQASGGSDRVQFFMSAETERENGIYEMPEREQQRLRTERGVSSLPREQVRPAALDRNNLRVNLSAQVAPRVTTQVSSAWVNSRQRLPQNNDNGNGLMVAAMGGLWRTDLTDSRGIPLLGYRSFPMGDVLSRTTTQDVNRFINSLQGRWQPTDWLSARATFGFDFASRVDQVINRFNEGIFQFPLRNGQVTNNRTAISQGTVDVGATATHQPRPWLGTKTSVGMQYIRNAFTLTGGSGENLPPGGSTITSAAIRNSTQSSDFTRTLGYYVEEVLSFDERVFITAAMRRDAASAFGSETRGVWYPKFGASWLLSDEGFMPSVSWLGSLRLRATYGASGQLPGPTDALRFYSPFPATLSGGTDAPSVSIGALGNAQLRPEFAAEFEGGVDATLFGGATNLELTYYDKRTKDALVERRIAPSLAGVTSRLENIGDLRNSGIEVSFTQRLLDTRRLAADVALTGSTNRNELVTLGTGVSAIPSGNRNTQLNRPGYPLFGMWGRTYTYRDANGDGRLSLDEVTYSDSAQFIGPSFPTHEFALSPTIELFNRTLRISGQIDRKWGMRKLNNTLRHMCQGGASCRGLFDPDAPLAVQAAAIAAQNSVFTGFYEDGSFTRFRELSVSYQMPAAWANAVRATRWNVILTGRNLAVWSPFSGLDPETGVGNSDTRGNEEFFSTPPMRTWTLRMNFSF